MRRALLALLAAALPAAAAAASLTPPAAWRPAVLDVAVPGGGAERALLLRPADPRGTLVMLPGGDGEVGIAPDGTMEHADNVVIRTAPLWLARGWALLIPDAAGNLRGSRASPDYGAAVAALVAEAERRVPGRVVVVGTSQGAIAATNGAARAPGVSALVLLEAVSRRGGSGETLFDADPGAVTAPVLVVANAADRCPVTPPEDADRVAGAFTGSRRVAVLRVDGAGPDGGSGRACGSLSPHGYRGIEREVVDRVAAWLGE
ncbi:alpha/beta hydrolase [Lichenibacterium dinghuense]|uniref:alpha/beta hydrolase n=1 Tax=Lichenibacterium dinghuense TaxID=2895977 RepID=UPI001F3FCA53|nr:alpha/beta hydrolase [Lichenibacterium sp. 6Y81]